MISNGLQYLCKNELESCNVTCSYNRIFISVKPSCHTVENKECVFPFIYRNKRYAGCTSDSDINDKLWCSTQTDQSGRHAGETNWGYCKEEECPIEKNDT